MRWKKARLGLENKDLASKLGCSKKTITNILRYARPDKIRDAHITRLARVFGYASEREFLDAWHEGLPSLQMDKLVVDDQPDEEEPDSATRRAAPNHGSPAGNVAKRTRPRKR